MVGGQWPVGAIRNRPWLQGSSAHPAMLGSKASCVIAKSVNSVFAFGAKSSVHFLTPPFPTEPTSLGFGGDPVREVASARTAEGLMQSSWLSCAKSDYSMSKNRTAHNRILHSASKCAGTIPQSRRRKVRELRFRLWAKSFVHSLAPPFPTEPACAGLRRGPQLRPAPFTQRGLWCGGIQRVRWKIETAVQEPLRQHS